MNPFLFSFVALCIAQGAVASQYGSPAPSYQRKMSPSPQTYSAPAYGQQQQSYSAPATYEAPSSAQVSAYDERTPAAASSYGKQSSQYAPTAASSYARPQQASYSAPQAYAKPAPKYEEPYYPPMPFSWGYDLSDGYGAAQYHKETGDEYGKRVGSYGYTDAYGIYRQVDYVADENGFRATVKSNEPGLQKGAESPASTEFLVYEPPSNYYASNSNSYAAPQQQHYAAPAPASSYAPSKPSYQAPAAPAYAPAAPQSYSAAPRSSYGKAPSSASYGQSAGPYAAASSPSYQKAAAPKAY